MYNFRHLPAFAQFILDNHIDEYVNDQIQLSYKMDIPLLQYLKHLSREQLFQQSKLSAQEMLGFIADNNAKGYLEMSMQRWVTNQLNIVDKFDIVAEDITLINYVRQESLKKFLPGYTNDTDLLMAIVTDLNTFILGNNTTASNTYMQILKNKIEEETLFTSNIINASPAIIFIYDLIQQRESFITGKVEEVMGFTPKEVMDMGGEMVVKLAHPEDLHIIAEMIQKVITENNDQISVSEYRFKDKSGKYHWMRTYVVIFKRDEKGQPVEILGQTFEVSKEKELMLALEKREKELLEAQSIAKVGSFDWDFATDTTQYTPELRRIFETETPPGYESFLSQVHPEDKQKVVDAMSKGMEEGYYECEYRYIANGKEKVLLTRGGIVYQDEKPVKMIGTVHDITERKQFEESLFEKTIELQKSNASLQEVASVASHDLKEPLRKIITFSDMVVAAEKETLSTTSQAHLQKVIESSRRMKTLIDDILTFSTLGGKEEKQHKSLKEVVQDVLNTLEVRIKEKNAEVTVSDLPVAMIYPTQMQQLFLNLISNALKFHKEDEVAKIQITHSFKRPAQIKHTAVTKASKYLEIHVADNGIGFNNEAAEKIFQLFLRLHNRSQYEGTGLGLAICRKVAENHGGTITAASEPGKGSVFTLTLPLL